MGDPLSVAGTAVGIISLGLSVCTTIVDYGRAYRGYDEDIQNIKSKAESFHETLEIVDDAIKYAQKTLPKIAIILSKKVMRIEHLLKRLNSKIERYGPEKSRESWARKALKKSAYPFRKDDFQDVAADLDSMQGDLQSALAILSYIHIFRVSERIEMQMINSPRSLTEMLREDQEPRQIDTAISSNASTDSGYLIEQRKTSAKKIFCAYSLWLGRAIEIGFSISWSLKVQVIISPGCQAYDKLQALKWSLQCPDQIDDRSLQLLKRIISDHNLDLSCATVHDGSVSPLLDVLLDALFLPGWYKDSGGYAPIFEFLLDQTGGVMSPGSCWMNHIWTRPRLLEKHVPLIVRLANAGLEFDIDKYFAWTPHTKPNLLLLLSKMISMPEVLRLICRGNVADLRAALREGRVSASKNFGFYSLLEWTFDWPEGVRILLEFGADPKQCFQSLAYPGMGRHSSAVLLLREGCILNIENLNESVSCGDGGERMKLLVNELTERRKKLRKLAEDSLPWASISDYVGDRILDGQDCQKISGLLIEHKTPFPHSFTTQDEVEGFLMVSGGQTVYHGLIKKQCAEALYQAGFLDTDMLDSQGNSPLSSFEPIFFASLSDFIEMIQWHMSKGADLHRRLPWANESVSHLLATQIITYFLFPRKTDHSSHVTKAGNNLQNLIAMSDGFFAPTKIPDGCSCPCSPDGCTTISVILREFPFYASWHCRKCLREVFEKLEEWDQSYWKDPRAFIRSLTFNALDLNHTCFANTKKGDVFGRHRMAGGEDYINDNRDEQSALIEFEELVADLEQKFDELSLPLKEFLPGPWYRCVKDHLLTRQPHKEEDAIADARSLGVGLEFCGLGVPEWMEILIANKVEELSDEY